MKKVFNKKTFVTLGLLSICSLGFTQVQTTINPGQPAMEFKYIGNLESHPMFSLNLNNSEKEDYMVYVKDESNHLLFSEEIKGENLSRKYQLDFDESEIDNARFKVTFEITSRKTHQTTTYNVTKKQNVVEDILIAKL